MNKNNKWLVGAIIILAVAFLGFYYNSSDVLTDKITRVEVKPGNGNSQLAATLSNVQISKTTYAIGEDIIITGVMQPHYDGDYYIEFGLDKSSPNSI